jgi:hypothetical protein
MLFILNIKSFSNQLWQIVKYPKYYNLIRFELILISLVTKNIIEMYNTL